MLFWTRRRFMSEVGRGALSAGLVGAAPLRFGGAPRRLLVPGVRPSAELAEVVRWIREVPAERIVAEAIDKLRGGLPPQQLWAATFLAGIEDVEPRPVGFRFHCVMVMPALRQVASELPPDERVLPLFFGLWNFKRVQGDDPRSGDWTLPPVQESALPPKEKARAQLIDACETWDAESADAAVTTMARTGSRDEIVETLLPFGMRNWANIGHHPIFTSSAFKVLDVIGWRHAEPVLRSLVHGLLVNGWGDDVKHFALSCAAAEKLVSDGLPRSLDPVGAELRPIGRADVSISPESAIAASVKSILARPDADAEERLWSDLEAVGLELLMEKPGLLPVHATTGIRALRELALRAADPRVRLAAAFQAAAWCPLWRSVFGGGGEAEDSTFASLARNRDHDRSETRDSPESLVSKLGTGGDRELAPRIARSIDSRDARARFLDGARRLLVAKGGESHHYKFLAALETVASPAGTRLVPDESLLALRLAAGAWYMHGPTDADFGPVAEARAALAR